MITNKDIRVENGNLVLNGDKFPLDGQSPETIMDIVEDNSDTTPTENSTAPITSGGVYTALGTKQDTLTFDNTPTDESTNPVTSGGVHTALAGKQDTLTFDNEPTVNSINPVKSGGVYNSILGLSGNFITDQYTDFDVLPHGSIVQVHGSAAHTPGNITHYYIVFTYFIGGTTTYKLQFAIENVDNNLYTRSCSQGTWGNWNKFTKATS